MDFEIISDITKVEVIATGTGIRDRVRLRKQYGQGKWRTLKGIAQVQLPNGMIRLAEIHWYEAHGVSKKRVQAQATVSRLTMKTEQVRSNQFVGCLNNEGYKASLEVGKIYRVIVDEEASKNGLVRVIDESGEDYAFSANRFYPIEVPKPVEEVLLAAC